MAAGLGFKTFTTGEVLTAADTNGYLMQGVLVFASSAARAAAITSPQEGQYSYLKDTNSTEYYDGAAWIAAPIGDITGVTAGTGISGGGTSGTVTITNSMATEIAAKGDLIVGTGAATFDNLTVGANGTTLVADSSTATGLKWATASSSPTFVGALVTKSTGQSLTSGTAATLTWNTESFDTNGFHDNSTNNSRLTVPTGYGGKYYWTTTVGFGIAAATGNKTVVIRKNGTDIFYTEYAPSAEVDFTNLSGVISMNAGDYLEVRARQTSGGAVTVQGDDYNATTVSFFSVTYLGA